MTRKTRRIIFYTLVALFFVIGYLIMLFAFGYKLDLKSWQLVKTAAVMIKSEPKGSQILINDHLSGQTSSFNGLFRKKYLSPGEYKLESSKQDFQSWKKTMSIKQDEVIKFYSILLPQNYEPKKIEPQYYTKPALNEITKYFINSKDGLIYEKTSETENKQISKVNIFETYKYAKVSSTGQKDFIYILANNKSNDFTNGDLLILNQDGTFMKIAEDIKDIAISPDNKKIALWNDNEINVFWLEDDYTGFAFYKKDTKETIIRLSQKIQKIYWHYQNQHLVFQTEGKISLIELDGRGGSRNIMKIIDGSENFEYLTDKNQIIFLKDKDYWLINL